MLPQERNIVYEAAPPAAYTAAESTQDIRDYPNSTYTVISKIAYLIGVPKRFLKLNTRLRK